MKKRKKNRKFDNRLTGSSVIDEELQTILYYVFRDFIYPWYVLNFFFLLIYIALSYFNIYINRIIYIWNCSIWLKKMNEIASINVERNLIYKQCKCIWDYVILLYLQFNFKNTLLIINFRNFSYNKLVVGMIKSVKIRSSRIRWKILFVK